MRVVFNSLSIIKNSVSKPNLAIFSPGKRFQPQLFHFPIFSESLNSGSPLNFLHSFTILVIFLGSRASGDSG